MKSTHQPDVIRNNIKVNTTQFNCMVVEAEPATFKQNRVYCVKICLSLFINQGIYKYCGQKKNSLTSTICIYTDARTLQMFVVENSIKLFDTTDASEEALGLIPIF